MSSTYIPFSLLLLVFLTSPPCLIDLISITLLMADKVKTMKKGLYILGIIMTILIGTYFYWKICCSPKCCSHEKSVVKDDLEKEVISQDEKTTQFAGLSLKDNNLNLECDANFNFLNGDFKVLDSSNVCIDEKIELLKNHLGSNPLDKLKILGYHGAKEDNNSAYSSLGLARSNAIKNYLKSAGIDASQIICEGEEIEDIAFSSDTVNGPNSLSLIHTEGNQETTNWNKIGEEIKANPLVLYFETAKSSISLSEEQKNTFMKIVTYMVNVEGAKCLSTGYTDNDGSNITNNRLGLKRANFAKEYLVKNGLTGSQVIAKSKGKANPIADNNTEEGRAKNRRVVVTIK